MYVKRTGAFFAIALCALVSLAGETVSLDRAVKLSAADLSSRLPKGTKVVVLNCQADSSRLSNYVIEEMTAALVNGECLTVVDRKDLDLIQKEMSFQLSGEVSDESAQSIGQKLGAQSIISGSVTNLGATYRFRMKAINVTTAAIENLFSITINDLTLVKYLASASDSPSSSGNAPSGDGQNASARTRAVPAAQNPDATQSPVPARADPVAREGKPIRKVPARAKNFEVMEGRFLSAPIDRERFHLAALKALEALRYTVKEDNPSGGTIVARLEKNSWWVDIRICYWDDEYWFEYVDSRNLDANPRRNTIHPNYLRWIPNLDKSIGANY